MEATTIRLIPNSPTGHEQSQKRRIDADKRHLFDEHVKVPTPDRVCRYIKAPGGREGTVVCKNPTEPTSPFFGRTPNY
jgi:hypothetical protein